MELKITTAVPDWDPNPNKSTTNNHNWRKCVIVEFPNVNFKWIPTYKQLSQILMQLTEVEQENRKLAIENLKNQSKRVVGDRGGRFDHPNSSSLLPPHNNLEATK